jgi:ribosomal protein S18 acetylase RimI-like enzyme
MDSLLTVLGKVEGEGRKWHGHVTAVSVASECRRLGLASQLMNLLEETTEKVYGSRSACCTATFKQLEPQ